ncbi:MAG: hypothetical protein QOJ11_3456 [Frankiales bacterium]|jgi:hypothetical protein|nr:hypothetical protein [Frankiales bacterium]
MTSAEDARVRPVTASTDRAAVPTSGLAAWVAAAPLALCAALAALTAVAAVCMLAGAYRPAAVLPLGLIAAAAVAWVVLRRLPPTPTRTLLPNLLAVAGVLATVAFNLKYSAQEIWVFRDPSTYALTGEWLAHHASVWIHTQPEVFGTVPGLSDGSLGFGHLKPGLVQSQYPDAAPMLTAMGGWISDATLLRVAPLIGGVALLGFYALARSVVREWWALGATALLAISMPMINFSRAVYSEPITMVFLLGGLALLFACDERGGWGLHLVTGMVFGATEIARVDGGLYFVAIAGYAVMRLARATVRRTAVLEVASMVAGWAVLFGLGVGMTHHLSPIYWASHGKEAAGLLAPGIGVALVGVVVVWLAWSAPERRERALGLVPRTAWAVAGLIVVAAAVGATRPLWLTSHHLINAGFTAAEASLQKADHLTIDGTRDYAESSLTWIAWYYGIVVVIAGVIGAAWLVLRFARSGRPALLGFLLVFLGSSVLFLAYPNIAPDQIWVMRRYLPIVLPGFVIAAAYVGWQLTRFGRAAQAGVAVLVLVSFGLAANTSSSLARVRQAVPELAEVENICANLPANAALLVVGGLTQPYTMTVRSYCRVPVAQLPAPTAATLVAVRKTAAARGKTLMVLADAVDELPVGADGKPPADGTVQPVSTLTIEQWNTVIGQAAHASGHPKRSMYLVAVAPDGTVATPKGQHVLTNATG